MERPLPAARDMERYYALCAPSAHRRALRLLGNREDARDVAQEAFVPTRWRNFDGRSSPLTYSYRVVTNLCLNDLEKRRVRESAPPARDEGAPSDAVEWRNLLGRLFKQTTHPKKRQLLVHLYLDHCTSKSELARLVEADRESVSRWLDEMKALLTEFGMPEVNDD